ncbi:MAG: polysaccharide biosynthesis protein [Acidobacteriia bacterium]|nr:polysaccharide biosynthesis protein [Terriglobia bacterium]
MIFFKSRRFWIWLYQTLLIAGALALAFALRFDLAIPRVEIGHLRRAVLLALIVKSAVFALARMDRGWWRYVGSTDLIRILAANVVASALFALTTIPLVLSGFPRSVWIVDFLLCFLGTAGMRFAVRIFYETLKRESAHRVKGLLVYGAGDAGTTLVREIRAHPSLGYRVVGFIDDLREKRRAVIQGLPVLGSGREIPSLIADLNRNGRKIDEVVITMPSASGRQIRDAMANCRFAGVACKILPGIGEILSGKVLISQIRELSVTDLLGRMPTKLDETKIRADLMGRCVLITGAAGSIGSELSRQVAQFEPRKLVLFDQAESDLFRIELELREKHPRLDLAVELGTIRDETRIAEAVRRHRVESIFHAAAYKHVPMMEHHVLEAVVNNVMGTWNLIEAARANHVSDFIMISSDKAVNPTSVMGLTKRVTELLASAMPAGPGCTSFVSVRFGNVLGSNGSVVPLFQSQIAAGGPVTVTHPEMRRYFMTIREAVSLVLQASVMKRHSEIFLLDMGEPIRIADLARQMIRLSGMEPDEDIQIRYTGMRPGEKLFEELRTDDEHILPTYHEKIKIFESARLELEFVEAWIEELRTALAARDESAALAHLRELVPEYQEHKRPEREHARLAAQVSA